MRSLATIRSLLQTMITLASASLGFVAALAWNDAIKATFKKFLGEADSLSAMYTYATVATIVAIVVVAGLIIYLTSQEEEEEEEESPSKRKALKAN